MKYFNYFKKKMVDKFDNLTSVTENSISFDNGIYFFYDFKDIEEAIGNGNYKTSIYETVRDIELQFKNEIENGLDSAAKRFRDELPEENYRIEILEGETMDAIRIVRRLDGVSVVHSVHKGIMSRELFQLATIPAIIDSMLSKPIMKQKLEEERNEEFFNGVDEGGEVKAEKPVMIVNDIKKFKDDVPIIDMSGNRSSVSKENNVTTIKYD